MKQCSLSRRKFSQFVLATMSLPIVSHHTLASNERSSVNVMTKALNTGEQRLKAFATQYSQQVLEVVPNKVYHVVGYGHSNATFIIGSDSVILVDTLDSDVRGVALKKLIATYTDKPVKTIIYTHIHPDHRGGAGAFVNTQPEIIAFASIKPPLVRSNLISKVYEERTAKQMGYHLTDEEALSQGYGIREGVALNREKRAFVAPTTVYQETQVKRTIAGVELELIAALGEPDDTIYIWLPEYKVVCCGDNYSGCWPNTAPLRGGQSRDLSLWIDSIDKLISLNATTVLLGHTLPLVGENHIKTVLRNFRDALDFVLNETLNAINQGLTMAQTVEKVRLPEKWANLPYLGEYYGTVEWTVRGIYNLYIGLMAMQVIFTFCSPKKKRKNHFFNGRATICIKCHCPIFATK